MAGWVRVCGAHTLSIVARVTPALGWKASRKSPRAAPCPEWAPPLLSTKGGVFIWHRLPAGYLWAAGHL